MTATNKNLYAIVEAIAEKEIERNPIEFIRKESFRGRLPELDEFFSLHGSDSEQPGIETVIEEEEYDSDENNHNQARAHQFDEEMKDDRNSSRNKSVINHDHLVEDLEDQFHDANDEFQGYGNGITPLYEESKEEG